MARKVPEFIGEVQPDGKVRFTMEFLRYLDDLENGSSNSIGTLLSGVNRAEAKADGIIAGTQVLASVTTADAGNIPSALNAIAGSSTGPVILNRVSVTNNSPLLGAGTATTQTVTATPNFGTGPYTYAWAKVSGTTFTVVSATSATTDFQVVLGDGNRADAIYRVTVTDSLTATATADVAVNAYSTPLA